MSKDQRFITQHQKLKHSSTYKKIENQKSIVESLESIEIKLKV